MRCRSNINVSLSCLQTSDQSSVQDVPTSQESGPVVANPPATPPQVDHAPTHTATAYSHGNQSELPPADRGGAYDNPAFTAANADWPQVFLPCPWPILQQTCWQSAFLYTVVTFLLEKKTLYLKTVVTLFNDVLTSLKEFFGSAFE